MPKSDEKPPEADSKTSQKKELHKLQGIAAVIAGLSDTQLAKIPLPEELLRLIYEARTITSHGAKKRHLSYVGKKLRDLDCEEIEAALERIKLVDSQSSKQFHQAEEWRERLISEDNATLKLFLVEFAVVESQKLRQLVKKAKRDKEKDINTGAYTQLFRYLKTFFDDRN